MAREDRGKISKLEKKLNTLTKNLKTKTKRTATKVVKSNFYNYFLNVNRYVFVNVYTILFIFLNFLVIYDYKQNGVDSRVLKMVGYFEKFELTKGIVETMRVNMDYILTGVVSTFIFAMSLSLKGFVSFIAYVIWVQFTPKQSIFMHVYNIWVIVYLLRTKKYQWFSILLLIVSLVIFTTVYVILDTKKVPAHDQPPRDLPIAQTQKVHTKQ